LGQSVTKSDAGDNNSFSIPLKNISQTVVGYYQGYAVANLPPGDNKSRILAARLTSNNGNPFAQILLPPGATVSSYFDSNSPRVTFFLYDVGVGAAD
jgi:hypothetical protein